MKLEFVEEDYLLIETLLRKYHDGDSEALGILLEKIEPLIVSTCKHYFGFADEDLLQSGRVCCIESIQKFDFSLKDIKFLGYQKRQLKYFYCDLKRAQVKRDSRECLLSTEGSYLMESLTYDELGYNKVEVKMMLGYLNYKERYIVEHNILTGETLKDVAKHLDINYDYAKELKKKAIEKLRKLKKSENPEGSKDNEENEDHEWDAFSKKPKKFTYNERAA